MTALDHFNEIWRKFNHCEIWRKLNAFDEQWLLDFEYSIGADLCPDPLCMIAIERRSGRVIRMWRNELRASMRAPFNVGPRSVVIAFSAPAEMACFLTLGWSLPRNVIDLYVENLAINNPTPSARRRLLAVLTFYGLAHTAAQEKKEMQDKAMSQTDWGDAGEREAMLDYCASNSSALYALLATMLEKIHIPTALMRGRYTPAVAPMERIGIPTDVELYRALSDNWEEIKVFFIKRDAAPFGVYEGTSLRQHLLAAYFHEHGIEWPLTPSGLFKLDRDTRRDQARAYPELKPLLTLMSTITDLKIQALPVASSDGHAKTWLAPFWTATGRNQPSPAQFLFAMPGSTRALIKPAPGHGVAYLDFSAQEVVVVAALSGDPRMVEDLTTGDCDPYLGFGRRAKLVPNSATKRTHGAVREQFKRGVLGRPME